MPVNLNSSQQDNSSQQGREIPPSLLPWNQPQTGGFDGNVLLAIAGGLLSGNPGQVLLQLHRLARGPLRGPRRGLIHYKNSEQHIMLVYLRD